MWSRSGDGGSRVQGGQEVVAGSAATGELATVQKPGGMKGCMRERSGGICDNSLSFKCTSLHLRFRR